MVILLITVVGLLVWATRLVQTGVRLKEFSLLFAGTLVAMSAVGVVAVYVLMESCMGYLTHSPTSGQFLAPLPPAALVESYGNGFLTEIPPGLVYSRLN
ncbi:hypothetical protein GS597_00140 [Synechococcales cyanobacterium C]|uniref:Uncharacterized protein n=1 Tax=Petrachloros mirabilis ULC683 TaxID=2781853 RepID=A0A8K2A681_9CYAN|nr:hypothetical protein [Petrachloros mirabilis]NCJ04955.1 hypothetical protein [Petrachloros mirabilis ULC683]